jgi:hypothetical protein
MASFNLEETKAKAGRVARRTLWIGLAAFVIFLAGYYVYRTWTYSDGNRVGLLFKVSKKGFVFKTYEGQLHQGGSMQMSPQSVWDFSVKNEAVYKKLQQYEGKNVSLKYRQLIDAFPWQGDTDYIVEDVTPVQ